jgi:hypothetical protein
MSENNTEITALKSDYSNPKYYNYKNAQRMPLDVFESEYITAKLSRMEIPFVRKNYSIPVFGKSGRLIVKSITPANMGSYEVYIKAEHITEFDGVSLRPKVIQYLKYSNEGYNVCSPEEFIKYNINWMKERKLEIEEKHADAWQFQLDNLTFLTR